MKGFKEKQTDKGNLELKKELEEKGIEVKVGEKDNLKKVLVINIVLTVGAIIALIILCYFNWDDIVEAYDMLLKDKISEIINKLSSFFF